MHGNTWFGRLCAAVLAVVVGSQFWAAAKLYAYPEFARQTKAACVACHTNPAGGAALSAAGTAFKAEKKAPEAATAKTAEYVGSTKCKTCHSKQHKGWLDTEHSRAMAPLHGTDAAATKAMAEKLKVELKESPAATPACVTCHVTGFQLAGGYPAPDSTKNATVAAVGCESCHGPGSLHVSAPMKEKKAAIVGKVSANMCKQCHTAETSPTFNFEEFKKRGVHATAAAATK